MGDDVPEEYRGREQTYLKHRVLKEYLSAWGQKHGSRSRFGRVRLWYVDCFAGPWESGAEDRRDTSVAIGLEALRAAMQTWGSSLKLEAHAVFVEKEPKPFVRLKEFLSAQPSDVLTHPLEGEFAQHSSTISDMIGNDAAFLFVDPRGWKGAEMRIIAPLLHAPRRDVMINVMSSHIMRWKDSVALKPIAEFIGKYVRAGAPEDELLAEYCASLKDCCELPYALELAVPHPTHAKTHFYLVLGAHHEAAVELFRNVERHVVGSRAALVREGARRNKREKSSGQPELALVTPGFDERYASIHKLGLENATAFLLDRVSAGQSRAWREIWPSVLEHLHVTRTELSAIAIELIRGGKLRLVGVPKTPKAMKDDMVVEQGS